MTETKSLEEIVITVTGRVTNANGESVVYEVHSKLKGRQLDLDYNVKVTGQDGKPLDMTGYNLGGVTSAITQYVLGVSNYLASIDPEGRYNPKTLDDTLGRLNAPYGAK